jgi:prephenate dehydratase
VTSSDRAMVCFAEPLGSSDHRAVGLFGFHDYDPLPMDTPDAVIQAVATSPDLYGVLPIENSIEGELTLTMDRLIFDYAEAKIVAEAVLGEPIWAFALSAKAAVHTVISHSMLLDLAAEFIRRRGFAVRHAVSSAAACEEVVASKDPGIVALAPPTVGYASDLVPVETEVLRVSELRTRYALLSRELPPATGDDRTMLVVAPRSDCIGALGEIAGLFARHTVNMYSILSRPISQSPEYHCFLIGAEGHVHDTTVGDLIDDLVSGGHGVKVLGSFPRWKKAQVVSPAAGLPKGMLSFGAMPNVGH